MDTSLMKSSTEKRSLWSVFRRKKKWIRAGEPGKVYFTHGYDLCVYDSLTGDVELLIEGFCTKEHKMSAFYSTVYDCGCVEGPTWYIKKFCPEHSSKVILLTLNGKHDTPSYLKELYATALVKDRHRFKVTKFSLR